MSKKYYYEFYERDYSSWFFVSKVEYSKKEILRAIEDVKERLDEDYGIKHNEHHKEMCKVCGQKPQGLTFLTEEQYKKMMEPVAGSTSNMSNMSYSTDAEEVQTANELLAAWEEASQKYSKANPAPERKYRVLYDGGVIDLIKESSLRMELAEPEEQIDISEIKGF